MIPVIADDFVDPQFGTGAVKVTPAHDPNDYDMSLRHNLPRVEVIDTSATMTEEAGPYKGLDRFDGAGEGRPGSCASRVCWKKSRITP